MEAISYERDRRRAGAVRAAQRPGAAFIGGGTNLLDLMKGGVARPVTLIDITHRGPDTIEALPGGGVRIGALVRNSDAADHPRLRADYPLLSGAARRRVRAIAQHGDRRRQPDAAHALPVFLRSRVRAMQQARAGQRLRGDRRPQPDARDPRCQLPVRGGEPVGHERVALAALDAVVQVSGPHGARQIPIASFHRLPADRPDLDTTLEPGELITAVDLPPPRFADHAHYLKSAIARAMRSRWCCRGCAADGRPRVADARIALGGVAHKPLRALEAEAHLVGRTPTDATLLREAAALALRDARPLDGNGFKIALAQRAIVRAVETAAAMPGVPHEHDDGQPLDRVDGVLKVTGGAHYAAEFSDARLAHAVLVTSTIASGRIRVDRCGAPARCRAC